MRIYFAAAIVFACLYATPAEAKGTDLSREFTGDRYSGGSVAPQRTVQRRTAHRKATKATRNISRVVRSDARVVAHPAGCPRTRFCGCGVSVRVFGHPKRELFLAANWRKFPPASPAPGMVAWRYGHVFYIEQAHGDGTATVYDPNSGRHLTRIHRRSLAGYRVVNPRVYASQYAHAR